MVISVDNDVTMVPERSSRSSFYNFSSIPSFNVEWGRQAQLRCVRVSDSHHASSPLELCSSRSQHNADKKRGSTVTDYEDRNNNGIVGMRKRLMVDFCEKANQMQAEFFKQSDDVVPNVARPWNLRIKRAVVKDSNTVASNRKPNSSPVKTSEFELPPKKNKYEIGNFEGPRAKFSVSLSKKEIEEDFLAITQHRPARRPKKRTKNHQRGFDDFSPGFWLTEITADMYKVNTKQI